jgi:hypothetical protein
MGITAVPRRSDRNSYHHLPSIAALFFRTRAVFIYQAEGLRRARRQSQGELLSFADGRTLEFDYHPVFLENEYQGHLWIFRDVTARERTRREGERFIEAFLQVLPILFIFLISRSERASTSVRGSPMSLAARPQRWRLWEAMFYSGWSIRRTRPKWRAIMPGCGKQAPRTRNSCAGSLIGRKLALVSYFRHRLSARQCRQCRPDIRSRSDITAYKALEAERDTAIAARKERSAVWRKRSLFHRSAPGSTRSHPARSLVFGDLRILDIDLPDGAFDYSLMEARFGSEDRVRLEEGMQNALKRRVPYALDVRLLKRDGLTKRWFILPETRYRFGGTRKRHPSCGSCSGY